MNLSQVSFKLKESNIQSFIDDFLKVEGVYIGDIILKEDIIVINKIKYKSFGTLSIGLKIDALKDGVVSISLKKLKAINIPISVVPINFIAKIILKKVGIDGLQSDGKQIKIELSKLLKKFDADFVNLNITKVKINNGEIEVVIDNFDLNMLELMNKSNQAKGDKDISYKAILESNTPLLSEKNEQVDEKESTINKKPFLKDDKGYFNEYGNLRNRISDGSLRDKKLIARVLFMLPDLSVLAYRLIRDNRVKKGIKILLSFTFMYTLAPIDFITDKIPVLGKIDDILLIVFTINKVFTGVDREIIEYHFDGDEDTLDFLMDSMDILNSFLGGEKINKLYTVVEKFVK